VLCSNLFQLPILIEDDVWGRDTFVHLSNLFGVPGCAETGLMPFVRAIRLRRPKVLLRKERSPTTNYLVTMIRLRHRNLSHTHPEHIHLSARILWVAGGRARTGRMPQSNYFVKVDHLERSGCVGERGRSKQMLLSSQR
jgi:hypothetical protein